MTEQISPELLARAMHAAVGPYEAHDWEWCLHRTDAEKIVEEYERLAENEPKDAAA